MTESSAAPNAIDVDDVTCCDRFGVGLKNFTLRVPAGDWCCMLGRNGSGKTTCMQLMMGRHTPQAGSCRVYGIDCIAQPELALQNVAYVSDSAGYYPDMQVGHVLDYTRGSCPTWDAGCAHDLLENLNLTTDRPVAEMPASDRVGLEFLLALASRPRLLLIDSDHGALDAFKLASIKDVINGQHADGMTVIWCDCSIASASTHLPHAKQLVFLKQGQVIVRGSERDLLQSHSVVNVRFPSATATLHHLPGAVRVYPAPSGLVLVNCEVTLPDEVEQGGLEVAGDPRAPTLDEIFLAYTNP